MEVTVSRVGGGGDCKGGEFARGGGGVVFICPGTETWHLSGLKGGQSLTQRFRCFRCTLWAVDADEDSSRCKKASKCGQLASSVTHKCKCINHTDARHQPEWPAQSSGPRCLRCGLCLCSGWGRPWADACVETDSLVRLGAGAHYAWTRGGGDVSNRVWAWTRAEGREGAMLGRWM